MNNTEVIIQAENLVPVKKLRGGKREEPTFSVTASSFYLNGAAARMLNSKYVRWFTTTDYLIGLPATINDVEAFALSYSKSGLATARPAELRGTKTMANGRYKVFKYQNGIAIKKYNN